jgi:hypothetical protein
MIIADNRRLSQVLSVLGKAEVREEARINLARMDGGFALRVAGDRATREKAYRLVYEQYLEKGYTQQRTSAAWVTLHDALPETVTLVVEKDGRATAAGTVVPDSPLRLPADDMYSAELSALRRAGRCPAEVISLATAGMTEDSRLTLAKLFNAAYFVARGLLGVTDLVITVNPRHVPFYKRILLFEELGGERACGKVGGAPAVLLRLDLEKAESHAREAAAALPGDRILRTLYPMFATVQGATHLLESLRASIRPMDGEDLGYFLVGLSDVLESAKPTERRYLQGRYPQCDFSKMFLTTTVLS